jgi:hypothetical protein
VCTVLQSISALDVVSSVIAYSVVLSVIVCGVIFEFVGVSSYVSVVELSTMQVLLGQSRELESSHCSVKYNVVS